ncbi:MAG: DEAD/DEAH box helicase, partial [Flavobacteriales bacterium CG_4_10_14_0_8_um_filter_32_5]
ARQRALSNFKEGKTKVLVATDIAARGIDISDLALVINYDIPNIPETYVHRIGRTGRASASGISISFCDVEERPYLRDIEKLIRQKVPVIANHPFLDESKEDSTQTKKPQNNNRPKQAESNNNRNNWRRNKSQRT